jgi:hypothetical protein
MQEPGVVRKKKDWNTILIGGVGAFVALLGVFATLYVGKQADEGVKRTNELTQSKQRLESSESYHRLIGEASNKDVTPNTYFRHFWQQQNRQMDLWMDEVIPDGGYMGYLNARIKELQSNSRARLERRPPRHELHARRPALKAVYVGLLSFR